MNSPLQEILKKSRNSFLAIMALSAAVNILSISGSIFMLQVYDRVLSSKSVQTLIALFIIVVVLLGFQALFDSIRIRMVSRIGHMVDHAVAASAFRANASLLQQGRDPNIRLTPLRDLDTIRSFICNPGAMALCDLPWIPINIIVIYLFHPLLGYLTILGAMIIAVITLVGHMRTRGSVASSNSKAVVRQNVIDESISGSEILETMGLYGRVERLFLKANQEFLSANLKSSDVSVNFSSTARACRQALQSSVLALAAYLAIRQEISAGVIVAASILSSRALAPIDAAIANWRPFVTAMAARARLKISAKLQSLPQPQTDLPLPEQSIACEGVIIGPPGSQEITLRNISFALTAGDAVGLIGRSGAGKSSLAKALVGAWTPMKGIISADGAPLDQYKTEARGAFIGYLPQSVDLFSGTIAENISRFDPERRDEDVIEAARMAGVHSLVLSLPQGYDTSIGAKGTRLSIGQRQRIGLARALYKKPFVLVLDEPYSNLDGEGEAALNDAILVTRRGGGIVVLIAHRHSALRSVNKLLVIDDGMQVDFGPKDDVLSRLYGTSASPPFPAQISHAAPSRQNETVIALGTKLSPERG